MFWRVPDTDNYNAHEHYSEVLSQPLGVEHLIERGHSSYYDNRPMSDEDVRFFNDRMLSNALSTVEDIEKYFNAIADSNYGARAYPSDTLREKWPLFKEYLDSHTSINEYGDTEVITDAGNKVPLRHISKELNNIYCQMYSEGIKSKLIDISQHISEETTIRSITKGYGPYDNNVLYFLHNFPKFPELNLEESNMYQHLRMLTDAALSEILTIEYEDVHVNLAEGESSYDFGDPMYYGNVVQRITDTLRGVHPYAPLYLDDKNLPTLVFQHLYYFIPHGAMDAKKKEMLDIWMNSLGYVFDFLQKVIANNRTASKDESMDYNSERGQFLERWSPEDELGGALDSAQFQDSMYQDYFTAPDIRSDIDKEVMEFSYAPPLGVQSGLQFIKKTADPLTYTDGSDFDRDDNYTNQADFVHSTNVDGTEMRDGFWGETDWRFFNPTDVFDTIDNSNDYAAQPVLAYDNKSVKDEVFIYLKVPNSVREQFNHIAKLEEDLHVTLMFLKKLKLNGHSHERLIKELSIVAKAYTSITCKSNGAAVFNDDDNSHVMLVNAKNISKLHNDLKDAVAAAHSNINSKYDFIPHMTLRSNSNGKADVGKIPEVSWNNRSFFVKLGKEFEYRIAFGTGKVTELNLAIEKLSWREQTYDHKAEDDFGGDRFYNIDNELHRLGDYAAVEEDGTRIWYQNGEIHREDGPAIIYPDGSMEWFIGDNLHREGGPAVDYTNGLRGWYQHNKLHREDGPAVEEVDGTMRWYIKGKELTEEEFNNRTTANLKFNLDNMSKFSRFNSSNYNKELDNGKLKTFSEDTWSEGQEEAQEENHNIEEVPQINQEPERQIVYPSVDDILDLHDDIILQFGGTAGTNELTVGKVEASIGRMQSGFGDEEFFKSVVDKASVLIHSIVSTHPFTDGNKRTGMMSGIAFMDENGYTMDDSEHLADTIVSLSTSDISLEQMIEYMNKYAYQIIKSDPDEYNDTMQSLSWRDELPNDKVDIGELNRWMQEDVYDDTGDEDRRDSSTYDDTYQIPREKAFDILKREKEAPGNIHDVHPELSDFRSFHIATRTVMGEEIQDLVGVDMDGDSEVIAVCLQCNIDLSNLASLKFAGFDDTSNPYDPGPKEEIPYGDTEKRENEGIVRNRFHNEEAELIYEVGLHQDMNRPETNRPLTPYASQKLSWREKAWDEFDENDKGNRYYNTDGKLHHLDGPAVYGYDGTKKWYINGKLHREDGPAVEVGGDNIVSGTKKWYINGKLHREDGPAIEHINGDKSWYQRGNRFRDNDLPTVERAGGAKEWYVNNKRQRDGDLPAIEFGSGDKWWYQNGKQHRLDGPAVENVNGTKFWCQNGKFHREDGPAVEKADGSRRWWIHGVELTEDEFNNRIQNTASVLYSNRKVWL